MNRFTKSGIFYYVNNAGTTIRVGADDEILMNDLDDIVNGDKKDVFINRLHEFNTSNKLLTRPSHIFEIKITNVTKNKSEAHYRDIVNKLSNIVKEYVYNSCKDVRFTIGYHDYSDRYDIYILMFVYNIDVIYNLFIENTSVNSNLNNFKFRHLYEERPFDIESSELDLVLPVGAMLPYLNEEQLSDFKARMAPIIADGLDGLQTNVDLALGAIKIYNTEIQTSLKDIYTDDLRLLIELNRTNKK